MKDKFWMLLFYLQLGTTVFCTFHIHALQKQIEFQHQTIKVTYQELYDCKKAK